MESDSVQCHDAVEDDIGSITPTTISAVRVVELVRVYGRKYANGELDMGARNAAVTGSEIPTICGENMFDKPNTVFFRKVFNVHIPDTPAMIHGRTYEPIALSKFRKQTGAKVFYVRFMLHERHEFIGGTFDALAIMPSGEGVLVEVKCPYTRSIGSSVPPHYVGQVQTYLEIANLSTCLFVQYKASRVTPVNKIPRPEKLSIISVSRDSAYFTPRLPTIWNFWIRVCAFKAGVLPTASSAAICIQRMWRCYKKNGYAIDPHTYSAICQFRNERIMYRGIKDFVFAEMEKRSYILLDTAKMTLVVDVTPYISQRDTGRDRIIKRQKTHI